jgi:hypothetical protein
MSSDSGGVGKWIAGIIAAIISGVAVYYLTEANKPDPPPRPELPPTFPNSEPSSEPASIEFTVLNELGEIQVSEEVQIYMNGQLVANLIVNQQQVTASAKVKVPKAGSYNYTVLADGIFFDQFGQTYRQQGRGDGVIEVNAGSVFTLAITPHGVRLVPR